MAENTGIEWATHTWNPWLGCTKVSPGCAHCYAETAMDDRWGKVKWGPNGTRVKTSEAYWKKPLGWEKLAATVKPFTTMPVRVFPSLCDVFEDWNGPIADSKGDKLYFVGPRDYKSLHPGQFFLAERPLATMDDLRRDFFALIDATPHLTWLLLTKRPENILKMWPTRKDVRYVAEAGVMNGFQLHYRPNVWLGCSVENQATADERIPELLQCHDFSPVLWCSYEPALGPVDFDQYLHDSNCNQVRFVEGCICSEPREAHIQWLVIGGESGSKARRFDVAWGNSAIRECAAASVPVFVKQMGRNVVDRNDAGFEAETWTNTESGLPVDTRAWPTPLDVEHHINGFREDYQGAPCRVVLKDQKGGDPREWPYCLRVRQYPEVPA